MLIFPLWCEEVSTQFSSVISSPVDFLTYLRQKGTGAELASLRSAMGTILEKWIIAWGYFNAMIKQGSFKGKDKKYRLQNLLLLNLQDF